jgi:hypothetical protein
MSRTINNKIFTHMHTTLKETKNLYLDKLSFKSERETKIFKIKQKMKKYFINSRNAMQEMFKSSSWRRKLV